MIERWNDYNEDSSPCYAEGIQVRNKPEIRNGEIELCGNEWIDIPYHNKILRITVSEWGSVQLLDSVSYTQKRENKDDSN